MIPSEAPFRLPRKPIRPDRVGENFTPPRAADGDLGDPGPRCQRSPVCWRVVRAVRCSAGGISRLSLAPREGSTAATWSPRSRPDCECVLEFPEEPVRAILVGRDPFECAGRVRREFGRSVRDSRSILNTRSESRPNWSNAPGLRAATRAIASISGGNCCLISLSYSSISWP